MSFPAEGVEATIKNHIDDVRGFLDLHHANCYAVYNCSQRLYRASKFQNRVSVSVFDVYRYGCVNCVWQKINIGLIRNLRMKNHHYNAGYFCKIKENYVSSVVLNIFEHCRS